ncbi:MAG: MFS transporter [Deltaproteobacteria bacterium]|nr:MFS transporter [Deltaproteobacteria bacterium]
MPEPRRLMNRHFFLLWQGQLVSQVGSAVFGIAMMFWIKHATGSATLMGLIAMVSALPMVIFGPIGGTFADRHSRRLIIIYGDILRGLVNLSIAFLLFLAPGATEVTFIWLFVGSIIGGIIMSFFNPAVTASIPDLVPKDKIAPANSLNQFAVQVTSFLGQGIGGLLYRVLGMPVLALFNGLTFLFSAISETFITIPQEIPEKNGDLKETLSDFKQDLVEGMSYIWRRKGLRTLIFGFSVINFFSIPIIILFPFYVEDFLLATSDWMGYLAAAFGLGAMGEYLFAGVVNFSGNTRKNLLVFCIIFEALLMVEFGLVLIPWVSLCVIFILGLCNGFLNIGIMTILQQSTPSVIRGRVFGLVGAITGGLAPIAMGLSGVLADLTGQNIPLIYISCGVITFILTATISFSTDFRRFLAFEPDEPVPENQTGLIPASSE